jgi:hypothetical protein
VTTAKRVSLIGLIQIVPEESTGLLKEGFELKNLFDIVN